MQYGAWTLVLNEFKAKVPQVGTPAECMLQLHMHSLNSGEYATQGLRIYKKIEVPKVTAEENHDDESEIKKFHDQNYKADVAKRHNEQVADAEKRSDQEERMRLATKYLLKHDDIKRITLNSVFPPGSKLPQTFAEVLDTEGNSVFDIMGDLKPKKITIGEQELTHDEIAAQLAELKALKAAKK